MAALVGLWGIGGAYGAFLTFVLCAGIFSCLLRLLYIWAGWKMIDYLHIVSLSLGIEAYVPMIVSGTMSFVLFQLFLFYDSCDSMECVQVMTKL